MNTDQTILDMSKPLQSYEACISNSCLLDNFSSFKVNEKDTPINYIIKKTGCIVRKLGILTESGEQFYNSQVQILSAELQDNNKIPQLKLLRGEFIMWYKVWNITYLKKDPEIYKQIKLSQPTIHILPTYTLSLTKLDDSIIEYEWYPTKWFCMGWTLYYKGTNIKVLKFENFLFKDAKMTQFKHIDDFDLEIFCLCMVFLAVRYELHRSSSSYIMY